MILYTMYMYSVAQNKLDTFQNSHFSQKGQFDIMNLFENIKKCQIYFEPLYIS